MEQELVPEIFTAKMEDGAEIKIRHSPKPGATRLFISNGNGFAIDGYRVFWEPLLTDFDVVLFDMRNHGRNDPCGADGHHYLQMGRDLATVHRLVSDELGAAPSVGVFHSMSSRAAMKHASENASPYDALVLYDPPSVPARSAGTGAAETCAAWPNPCRARAGLRQRGRDR